MEPTNATPTSAAPTDAQLLERARREDDPEAFSQLVERYKNPVVGYLAGLTGCRERAEDFAQETFVRFYQSLGRYREDGQLHAYLFRIGTNLVRSAERKKKRWRLLEPVLKASGGILGGATSGFVAGRRAPGPQAELLAGEERAVVARALEQLELPLRVPLVLREIEELSYQEIAAITGLAEGTVKSRLHRGRQCLKEKLASYWQDATSERDASQEKEWGERP